MAEGMVVQVADIQVEIQAEGQVLETGTALRTKIVVAVAPQREKTFVERIAKVVVEMSKMDYLVKPELTSERAAVK